MNDNDIQLITSLIGGELSEAEQREALARIAVEPELRAAYDEQLAVASLLHTTPPATMTPEETQALRATLATQLRLGDTVPAVAAAATSRWARWWAPLTGLAAAAVIVFAVVVVPNLGDDATFQEVGAPAADTTPSTAASDPLALTGEEELTASNGSTEAASTTTAAAASRDSEMTMEYFVAPEAAEQNELELPIVDVSSLALSEFNLAITRSVTSDTVDGEVLSSCFASPPDGSELTPVGLTADGSSVYATTTDPATGEDIVVLINLETCDVSDG